VQDSLALVDLYNSTDGPNWFTHPKWLTKAPVSTWYGITVTNSRVAQIYLSHNKLKGNIPSSFGNLVNLKTLVLSYNALSGSIPSSIGNLVKLLDLYLSNNQLSGIPSSLGNLVNLQNLDLSVNHLSSIPSTIGNLVNLQFLNLSSNQLTGIPSTIGNLVNLQSLNLSSNQLTGIPSSIGNLVNLGILGLRNNQLTSIPSSLSNLMNRWSLDLSNNRFGSVPSSIGNLVNLGSLNLSNNHLSGAIPSFISNLVNLTYLNLSDNQLSGAIPSSIRNLAKLEGLYLNNNKLSGSIPSSIGNLVNLRYLYLYNNQLSGSIPSSIGNLVNLYEVWLYHNELSDSIPSSIGNLVKVHQLYLDSNHLSGSLPSSLIKLHNIWNPRGDGLSLYSNYFTFAGLELIVQSFRRVLLFYAPQAIIPIHQNGNALYVSAGGTLSNNTYKWFRNKTLIATIKGDSLFHPLQSGNYFARVNNTVCWQLVLHTDTIYYDAFLQDSLALVDLYKSTDGATWLHRKNWLTKNRLSTWYGVTVTSARVAEVSLSSNGLSGSIPSSIGNLSNLQHLDLSLNQLNSGIPSSLGNLVHLTYLDVGVNKLSGIIPSSIGKLIHLTYLSMGGNQLTGAIPSSFTNLVNLDTLYLQFNQLSGSIPSFIGNFTKLTYLNLRHNQFNGSTPSTIGNLINLQHLVLDFNQLTGDIPTSVGKLVNLRELNLSSNQLKGTIPSLSNLHHLNDASGVLNLSHNGFTFSGMELIAKTFPNAVYTPQKLIPMHKNGNILSVSAGGTLSNNIYKWFRNGTLIATIKGDSVFHPAQSGNYVVQVKNSVATKLTLSSSTIAYPAINEPVIASAEDALQQYAKPNLFRVYPNPAKGIIHVETNGSATFSLINQSGKILFTTNINGKGIINVSGVAAGLYYLKNNSTGKIEKVIIER
jgi:Leucine-rich repeat (LRR) protein